MACGEACERSVSVVTRAIDEHVGTAACLGEMASEIAACAKLISRSLASHGRLLVCGNGGSAADAQHIAAELTGRFLRERQALPALALTTNTSVLTAISNDYGYDQAFARQVIAIGSPGDVLLAISTSGRSPNVLETVRVAKNIGLQVVGLTGADGGALQPLCDVCLCMPSSSVPRIQEMHILVGHILCQIIEEDFC